MDGACKEWFYLCCGFLFVIFGGLVMIFRYFFEIKKDSVRLGQSDKEQHQKICKLEEKNGKEQRKLDELEEKMEKLEKKLSK